MTGVFPRRLPIRLAICVGLALSAAAPAHAGPAQMSAAVACVEQAAVVTEMDRNLERWQGDFDLLGEPDMPRADVFIAAYNRIAERFNAAQERYRQTAEAFNAACGADSGPSLTAEEAQTLCADVDGNLFCRGFGFE